MLKRAAREPFQFHKVQLKADLLYKSQAYPIIFQFHKVQLKDNVSIDIISKITNFNSIRYN